MARKAKRIKTTGSHTSAIPTVERLLCAFNAEQSVSKISLGPIKSGIKSGPIRIKLSDLNPKTIRLKVRGPKAIQELTLYVTDVESIKTLLAGICAKRRWQILII